MNDDHPKYYFDEDAANRVVVFFEKGLRHFKGKWAGEPFILQDWQKQIVRDVFGWKRTSDDTRRYRNVYIEIPRKAGKSTFAAGIALYTLFCDREPGAEIYSTATTRDQGKIVFDTAKQMVLASPMLNKRAEIFKNVIASNGSKYEVISADGRTKDGFNSHAIICDELHQWKDRGLWDALVTSTGAREQPLILSITTAGFDKHSICYEQHEYAQRVADGLVNDDSFYGVIFSVDHDADWKSPDAWYQAQPALGLTVAEEYYETQCSKAQQLPAYENTFKRLLLNIWTEQDVRWLPLDMWDQNGAAPVDIKSLEGRTCYAGLDLATISDVAAFVMIFKNDDDSYDVVPHFWVPKDTAYIREQKGEALYDTWGRQGYITHTEGNVIDFDRIRQDIIALSERFHIKEIAIDRWAAQQLLNQLSGDGLTMTPFAQGFKTFNEPSKELERLVLSEKLHHGNNPVLRWMAGNVSVEFDAMTNIKPSKKKSTEKIDGIVALIMALGIAINDIEDDDADSVYEARGIRTL
jgi:phage terminase large subunit-like protein